MTPEEWTPFKRALDKLLSYYGDSKFIIVYGGLEIVKITVTGQNNDTYEFEVVNSQSYNFSQTQSVCRISSYTYNPEVAREILSRFEIRKRPPCIRLFKKEKSHMRAIELTEKEVKPTPVESVVEDAVQ